jgi:hypothetical protein
MSDEIDEITDGSGSGPDSTPRCGEIGAGGKDALQRR